MGFKSDQFYGIKGGVGQNGIGSRDDDLTFTNRNPRFAYPGQWEGSVAQDGKWRKHLVQRGFMKVLPQTKSGAAVNSKWASSQLFFQFNPQTIRRSVSMRSDFMNPMLQDPGQFILPVPGNANFTFDLMFDRSMELNTASGGVNDWWSSDGKMFNPKASPTSSDPSELGVLVDMNLLDQIVGQGISKDMIDYIVERGNVIYSQQVAESTSTTTNADGTTSTTSELPAWDEAKVRSALDNNVGNQAFLIPNPVRVVFSSLFMVDGYVQSMDVAYVKFTQTMIPQQVVISIQMQAMYLGFARAKTFLTTALENAEPAVLDDPSNPPTSTSTGEARTKLESLLKTAGADITKFKMLPKGAMFSTNGPLEQQKTSGERGNNTPPLNGFVDLGFADPDRYLEQFHLDHGLDHDPMGAGIGSGFGYFPGIVTNESAKFVFGFPKVKDGDDPIKLAFDSGSTATIKSISYSWELTCYRKQLGLEDTPGEESTSGEYDVELFNYTFSSGEIGTGSVWKDNKYHKGTSIANGTFAAKGGNKKQARRLYVTDRMSDSAWRTQAQNKLYKPTTSGRLPYIKWFFNVTVNVTDTDGNTLIYHGKNESLAFLDAAPDFDITLTLQE